MPTGSAPTPRRARKRFRALFVGLACVTLTVVAVCALYLLGNRASNLAIPMPVLPTNNAYDDFVRAGKLAKGMMHLTPSNMPGPPKQTGTLANYRAAAADFAPSLAIIHSALSKPCLSPPVRTFGGGHWQYSALFRNLARNVGGAGRYEQLAGHPVRAADIWLDGMEMGEMLAHGGGLMDGLLCNVFQSICLAHFEELLPHLTARDLQHVAERLTQIQAKHVAFSDILLEDGYASVAGAQDALSHPDPARKQTSLQIARGLIQSHSDAMPSAREALQIAQFVFASKEGMLMQTLDYYRAIAREAQQPFQGESRIPVPNNPLSHALLSNLIQMRVAFVRQDALSALIRTEVALARYQAEHARLPDQLTALVPAYLPALPDDPFGGAIGKPLRYKPTGDGRDYLLYSVSANMTDEGGTPPPNMNDYQKGDLVARHLFPNAR